MRIHYLQHVPFETPAAIGDWANQSDATLSGTKLWEGTEFPRVCKTWRRTLG